MRKITRIFIHCTAGSQKATVEDVKREFKNKGWKAPGYHYLIMPNGRVENIWPVQNVANGVQGYNSNSIHIAYIGGIDNKGKAVDNRTEEQKNALRALLQELHVAFPAAMILGHRDISPDKNKNGIVDPWERIKECPCFNVKEEYKYF